MPKPYAYVGPAAIRAQVANQAAGDAVRQASDVLDWARRTGQAPARGELLPVTFVIDTNEQLLIADRHSEHVACAGGADVLSAGEIFFAISGGRACVEEITNQSTGYCPEPESWAVVERVLERIGLNHPDAFTTACVFRKCDACGERNIVKDDWYACAICGKDLSRTWNFQA